MKRIHIINGPNLNLLGKREPEIYGAEGFETYLLQLTQEFPDVKIDYFQSNVEGELINAIQSAGINADGVILILTFIDLHLGQYFIFIFCFY